MYSLASEDALTAVCSSQEAHADGQPPPYRQQRALSTSLEMEQLILSPLWEGQSATLGQAAWGGLWPPVSLHSVVRKHANSLELLFF